MAKNHPNNTRRSASLTPSAADSPLGKIMVARDGIEPPTPAFSGLRSTD
jgi:hypothetical protein